MNRIECYVKLKEGAELPSYQTDGAAGADVRAFLPDGPITLESGKIAIIPTGVFLEIPVGFEIQVRPRSGLAFKNGVTVLNSPGTIDSDYRGEVKIMLINHSDTPFIIQDKERIAQFVFAKVESANYTIANELSDTIRGQKGFGSTGVK